MNRKVTETDLKLYRTAVSMLERSYSPFSGFRVGAALLTKSGEIITGVNIENSSLGATICAERTAFVKAISEGYREFDTIAIASSGQEAWPCGICRQFMYEFAPDLRVVTGTGEDNLRVLTLKELLPEGFRLQ
ncbi:MAG TPA: cytidine deaminase [Candidatus Avanaerovorax faecigallinarum]|nr:cytidine deaminase [Candidatus Avanaerovorax faecigallinarum]